jgi:hypothetical protein
LDDVVEAPDDPFGWQGKVHFDPQALAVEVHSRRLLRKSLSCSDPARSAGQTRGRPQADPP